MSHCAKLFWAECHAFSTGTESAAPGKRRTSNQLPYGSVDTGTRRRRAAAGATSAQTRMPQLVSLPETYAEMRSWRPIPVESEHRNVKAAQPCGGSLTLPSTAQPAIAPRMSACSLRCSGGGGPNAARSGGGITTARILLTTAPMKAGLKARIVTFTSTVPLTRAAASRRAAHSTKSCSVGGTPGVFSHTLTPHISTRIP
mmetsp:Transcript_4825/g.15577  ORF Transcript_4825/g.15577 Transcript_4825/m.15577 type:complete len:200 (-) Transcript_4825:188-787(-)